MTATMTPKAVLRSRGDAAATYAGQYCSAKSTAANHTESWVHTGPWTHNLLRYYWALNLAQLYVCRQRVDASAHLLQLTFVPPA